MCFIITYNTGKPLTVSKSSSSFEISIDNFSVFSLSSPSLLWITLSRSSPSEVFLGKGVLEIRSKFTGEHPCWSAISIKLQSKFHMNNSGGLLLFICSLFYFSFIILIWGRLNGELQRVESYGLWRHIWRVKVSWQSHHSTIQIISKTKFNRVSR